MTKKEIAEKYTNAKPVAVYPMSNWGGIEIMDMLYDADDYVVYRYNFGEPQELHTARIRYGTRCTSFRTCAGYRVRLNDCLRVG